MEFLNRFNKSTSLFFHGAKGAFDLRFHPAVVREAVFCIFSLSQLDFRRWVTVRSQGGPDAIVLQGWHGSEQIVVRGSLREAHVRIWAQSML